MELLDRMTNKVGPLPAWAWAAIPATAYVAYSYWRASQGDSYIDVGPDDGGADGTDAEDYGLNTGGATLPGYGSAPGGSSNAIPPVDTPKFTNEAWFRQASNWLITEGVISSDALTALNAYLYGTPDKITSTQMTALRKALARFGAAPDPAFVPEVVTTPAPPATNAPPPPTGLSAAAYGLNRISISWNPVPGKGVSYEIQRAVKGSGRWDIVTAVAATNYVMATTAESQAIRVRSRNAFGKSAWVTTGQIVANVRK